MTTYTLEEADRQPHYITFEVNKLGYGVLTTVKKDKIISSTKLNIETTQKIYNAMFKERKYIITAGNRLTNWLIKKGLIKINIEVE